MSDYIALFKSLFPNYREITFVRPIFIVKLSKNMELDFDELKGLSLSTGVKLWWIYLTKEYAITELRLQKIKELHEQLYETF